MSTPIVKKRIGDYTYEVYEIKNLKGYFHNVEILYQGKRISTNIPVYENDYTLTEVEKDVEFHIFTYGMLQNLTTSLPLVPPPPNTPIEIIPPEDKSNKKTSKLSSTTKTEGKVIDDNSNQPIKGAKVEINTPPPPTQPNSTPSTQNITPDKYDYRNFSNNWEIDVYSGNKLLATILCPNTSTTTITGTLSSPTPIIIDFSKLEDVKEYFSFYFNQNKLFFDGDGKIKQKNLLGENEDPFSLGVFKVIYPTSLPTETLSNQTNSLPNSNKVGLYSYTITQIPTNNPNTPDFVRWGAKIYYNNQFIQTLYYNSTYPEFSEVADNITYKTYYEYEASILNEINDIGYTDEVTLTKFPPHKLPQPTISNNKGEVTLNLPESTQTSTQSPNFPTSSISPPISQSSTPLPTVTISAPGYETIEKVPYKGDGTAKEDLGIIQMTPIQTATEADKVEASQLNSDQISRLSDSYKTPEYFAQKKLTDLVINLKQTALPLAITLIAQFGITKAYQLIDQKKKGTPNKPIYSYKNSLSNLKDKVSCPSPEELTKLISRKNKLVKQINNSLKIIDSATKILGITEGVIVTLDIAFKVLKNLPIPSSVPPGVGLPVNAILGVQDSKDTISKTITKLKTANTGLLTILVLIRQTLTQLLQYLSLLDTLIQQCSPDTELTQETISRELVSLTQNQSQDTPVITDVNGFKMGVETESTTNSLKRRRAIAQNKQGVVMLKGEWSFSSIDQILIDELVFYIQQNNLKAE